MFKTNYRETYTATSPSRFCAHLLCIATLLLLSACSVAPTTIVETPLTAKPIRAKPVAANSGAIYNASAYNPLFEDRRARMIGDTITISIVENTSATKADGGSGSKKGAANSSITSFFGSPMPHSNMAAGGSFTNEDKDAANSSNVFTGSITVTVVEVLANGNLLVSGEKQVSFDKGTEFVRFSGVINPDFVTVGNIVPSTKVADARIEYRSNTKIDTAQITSMLARFFLSLGIL